MKDVLTNLNWQQVAGFITVCGAVLGLWRYFFGNARVAYCRLDLGRLDGYARLNKNVYLLKNTRSLVARNIKIRFSGKVKSVNCVAAATFDKAPTIHTELNDKSETDVSVFKIGARKTIYLIVDCENDSKLASITVENGFSDEVEHLLIPLRSDFFVIAKLIRWIIPFAILGILLSIAGQILGGTSP